MDLQDGYKVTTAYAEQALFPDREALWRFKNRGPEKLGVLAPRLREVFGVTGPSPLMQDVGPVRFSGMLTAWPALRGMGVGHEFVTFLSRARDTLHKSCVQMQIADDEGDLVIAAAGLSVPASMYEIPVLGHVSDTWTRYSYGKPGALSELYAEGDARLAEKIRLYNAIPAGVCMFGEMGTRRALTIDYGAKVMRRLAAELRHYAGTSNIAAAAGLGVPCLRTMPHQWLQMGQALAPDLACTQEFMLTKWADVYRGTTTPLIALTDCLGLDTFLREFKPWLARMYTGVRHDSGDPVEWGNKILAHYDACNIDAKTKVAVFSDSLNPAQVFRILDNFAGKFKLIIFGIGTDFTNDCGVKALQIVMKLVRYGCQAVAKLADGGGGKNMCDDAEFVALLKKANGIPINGACLANK